MTYPLTTLCVYAQPETDTSLLSALGQLARQMRVGGADVRLAARLAWICSRNPSLFATPTVLNGLLVFLGSSAKEFEDPASTSSTSSSSSLANSLQSGPPLAYSEVAQLVCSLIAVLAQKFVLPSPYSGALVVRLLADALGHGSWCHSVPCTPFISALLRSTFRQTSTIGSKLKSDKQRTPSPFHFDVEQIDRTTAQTALKEYLQHEFSAPTHAFHRRYMRTLALSSASIDAQMAAAKLTGSWLTQKTLLRDAAIVWRNIASDVEDSGTGSADVLELLLAAYSSIQPVHEAYAPLKGAISQMISSSPSICEQLLQDILEGFIDRPKLARMGFSPESAMSSVNAVHSIISSNTSIAGPPFASLLCTALQKIPIPSEQAALSAFEALSRVICNLDIHADFQLLGSCLVSAEPQLNESEITRFWLNLQVDMFILIVLLFAGSTSSLDVLQMRINALSKSAVTWLHDYAKPLSFADRLIQMERVLFLNPPFHKFAIDRPEVRRGVSRIISLPGFASDQVMIAILCCGLSPPSRLTPSLTASQTLLLLKKLLFRPISLIRSRRSLNMDLNDSVASGRVQLLVGPRVLRAVKHLASTASEFPFKEYSALRSEIGWPLAKSVIDSSPASVIDGVATPQSSPTVSQDISWLAYFISSVLVALDPSNLVQEVWGDTSIRTLLLLLLSENFVFPPFSDEPGSSQESSTATAPPSSLLFELSDLSFHLQLGHNLRRCLNPNLFELMLSSWRQSGNPGSRGSIWVLKVISMDPDSLLTLTNSQFLILGSAAVSYVFKQLSSGFPNSEMQQLISDALLRLIHRFGQSFQDQILTRDLFSSIFELLASSESPVEKSALNRLIRTSLIGFQKGWALHPTRQISFVELAEALYEAECSDSDHASWISNISKLPHSSAVDSLLPSHLLSLIHDIHSEKVIELLLSRMPNSATQSFAVASRLHISLLLDNPASSSLLSVFLAITRNSISSQLPALKMGSLAPSDLHILKFLVASTLSLIVRQHSSNPATILQHLPVFSGIDLSKFLSQVLPILPVSVLLSFLGLPSTSNDINVLITSVRKSLDERSVQCSPPAALDARLAISNAHFLSAEQRKDLLRKFSRTQLHVSPMMVDAVLPIQTPAQVNPPPPRLDSIVESGVGAIFSSLRLESSRLLRRALAHPSARSESVTALIDLLNRIPSIGAPKYALISHAIAIAERILTIDPSISEPSLRTFLFKDLVPTRNSLFISISGFFLEYSIYRLTPSAHHDLFQYALACTGRSSTNSSVPTFSIHFIIRSIQRWNSMTQGRGSYTNDPGTRSTGLHPPPVFNLSFPQLWNLVASLDASVPLQDLGLPAQIGLISARHLVLHQAGPSFRTSLAALLNSPSNSFLRSLDRTLFPDVRIHVSSAPSHMLVLTVRYFLVINLFFLVFVV